MKIAITADVHLTTRADHPERYNALESILGSLAGQGISCLVIAGDLFDRDQRDFGEFESLCRRPEHRGITIHIVRGNHDATLRARDVVAPNVHIADEAGIVDFGGGVPFLMIPYEDTAMGEKIAGMAGSLEPGRWVLVGHGDYTGGRRAVNPHEKGVYMPLGRADLERFKPAEVFIGHIHKPDDFDSIHYPGSPCGLDINETGKRSFMVFDTADRSMGRHTIDTDVIWFSERFTIVPSDDEAERLHTAALRVIERWSLTEAETAKARIRVQARGYARDRAAVRDALDRAFGGYKFHDGGGVDVSGLEAGDDERCLEIAREAIRMVGELDRPRGEEQPTDDEVILAALELIYGSNR